MDDGDLTFRSKIDFFFPSVIGIVIISAPVGIYLVNGGHVRWPLSTLVALTAGIFPAVGLLVWMFLTTEYVIWGGELLVRSGPMKITVPIASISRIRRSHSLMSAPATSMSRLEIHYGRFNEVMISPADRRGFIRAITARVPNVVLEDLDDYR